jgi:hypothetical protein
MTGNIGEALWALIAGSSGLLFLGLLVAGLVHTLSRRFESLYRSVPRGIKAIAFGIVAGFFCPSAPAESFRLPWP